MKVLKKIYKKVLFVLVACYVITIFISQQKTLNTYKQGIEQCEEQILEAKESQESLMTIQENVNSPEYIEKIAREKLGMYLPNEKVYIDVGK